MMKVRAHGGYITNVWPLHPNGPTIGTAVEMDANHVSISGPGIPDFEADEEGIHFHPKGSALSYNIAFAELEDLITWGWAKLREEREKAETPA